MMGNDTSSGGKYLGDKYNNKRSLHYFLSIFNLSPIFKDMVLFTGKTNV